MKKVFIIGLGLIGSSIAKALIKSKQAQQIIGFDKELENLRTAKRLNIIQDYVENIKDGVSAADLIIISTPASTFKNIFKAIKPNLNKNTIITDVCSTKKSVIEDAKLIFGEIPENFVPAHPIAGKEKSGVEAGDEKIFIGKKIIITPVELTSAKALAKVTDIWINIGCVVELMDAKEHDKLLSLTSHLPHMLAFAIMNYIISQDNRAINYAASGFADFSRIASADANMWKDICSHNKDFIANDIKGYIETLNKLLHLVENDETNKIAEFFLKAKLSRDNWLNKE